MILKLCHRGLLVVVCALILGVAAEARGQGQCIGIIPIGSPIEVTTGTPSSADRPIIAYNGRDDEYLVAWVDQTMPATRPDIIGQRLSGIGALLGSTIAITTAPSGQSSPAIAYNGSGNNYLLVWQTQESGFFNKSRGRIVNADGTQPAGDFFVQDAGSENAVAYNSTDNEFLVTARRLGILGQRVSDVGALVGNATQIAPFDPPVPGPNGDVGYSTVSHVYLSTFREGISNSLRGQIVNPDGSNSGSQITIEATVDLGKHGAMAYDPANDRFLVLFTVGNDLKGRFVGTDGSVNPSRIDIATGLGVPDIAFSPALNAYVIVGLGGSPITVKLHVVTDAGVVTQDVVRFATGTSANGVPAIAHNSTSGEFLVVWPDDRNGGGDVDIFAQRITIQAADCNTNSVPDACDILSGTSQDCNGNTIPDECDIAAGTSLDCNTNGIPDDCDIAAGTSQDCNTNGIPDECDIAAGTSQDCNTNGIPDECDLTAGTSQDCNTNGVPDECDIAAGTSQDCNTNGIPDECDITAGTSQDCNANGVPDECDIASQTSLDCNTNGIPDECDPDGDGDGIPNACDQCPGTMPGDPVDANGCSTADEDGDGVLNDFDGCKGTPPCAIAGVGADGCPADADGDGLFDGCDKCPGADDLADGDGDGIPDCLDPCPLVGDGDGDGVQDCQDPCPNDPNKLDPGICGCGVADTDSDGDGIPDCIPTPSTNPAPQPNPPTQQQLQVFLPVIPPLLFPICGIGLIVPMVAVATGIWMMRRRRRRYLARNRSGR